MQNKVELTERTLVVSPQGSNKFFAMKNKLEFSWQEVAGASIDPEILNENKGLRGPGTHIPGYWAGVFTKNGEKTFYNIKRGAKPVVIQLKNAEFARLVLGVEEPEKLVDQINNQIG
ncbi:hypothetical protein LPAF129_19340 [Ligilactobacillus pabuli]|uniref:Bacterial Pleckstrin homology domain-containing protein n=1 Tax=Ligilactobacillus pabuli TaxID=2886039 RepID=A0ABQ5JKJ1_9LACO|nr:hypothetical protein [Ligilactobacillus pabuli]GKS82248.1 hypothetical protein LPAF129_19340 [Ligilactobacillus pabuli]HIW89666.1 hypothetical protein [Candidatus Ligilactobacillus excrementipullorum]